MPRVHDRGGWPAAGPLNKAEHDLSMWEKRTDAILMLLSNAEKHVIRGDGLPKQFLYLVRFDQTQVWEQYTVSLQDTLFIDIYEHWLEPA